MVSHAEQPRIHWRRIALVERFSSVLYPLDIEGLLEELPSLGYIVPAEKDILAAQGERLALTREIATKGELRLRMNQESKTLGVEGKQTDEVLEAFKAIRNLCVERLDPSKGFATAFVEIIGTAWIASKTDPIKVFDNVWAENPVLERLNKSLNTKFSQRGIHLGNSQDVESPSFSQIEVTPLVPAKSRYHVQVVWREPSVEGIVRVMEELDSTISGVIRTLESF